jgi:hypothetical protein
MTKYLSLKIVTGLIVTIMICSCDPVYRTMIQNDSKQDIDIVIQFDKNGLKKYWNNRPYISFLKGEVNDGGSLISFDTINLVAAIKLKPNEIYNVEGGLGGGPEFELIKKISIYSKDSMILDNQVKMHDAFKETETRRFELKIKK